MHGAAKKPWNAILGLLLTATLGSISMAADDAPLSERFEEIRSALHLEQDATTGLVSIPGMLDESSPDVSNETVSHLELNAPIVRDPLELVIDRQRLAPPLMHAPSTWRASVGVLAASRLDEDVIVAGQELGTGTNAGFRVHLANQMKTPDRFVNAWDIIAVGLGGGDELSFDPRLLYAPNRFNYKAAFVSLESNAIHRTESKRRVRQQFLGIRYIDQSDSIEEAGFYPYTLPSRQEASNRMLGLQVGLDQSWYRGPRWRFGWGAKAGMFYNRVVQEGSVYNGTGNTLPVLLDCHADLAFQIIEQAYLGIGLIGMALEDQYQSRFAWQAPESTHQLSIVGLNLRFDYTY